MRRSTSLISNTSTGIGREIGSQYDNVKIVADNIDGVVTVANGIDSVNALVPYTQQVSTVAGSITDVLTISENIAEITNVTTYMPEINVVGNNITDVVVVSSQIVPNLAEILLADDNAAIAVTKAGEALTSATNAAASELNASNSEAAALTSEQNAALSETNASGYAVAALSSKDAAAISETNASTSETNALASATSASTSEVNALASKQSAATSETNAGSSESAAALSASNAATSETNAAISASNAHTSALNAAASETNASSSELAAQTAQGIAETARDQAVASADFVDDIFLGAKTVDPATDNDGNSIQTGAMYYNTALLPPQLKIYDGTNWQQAVFDTTGAVFSFNGRDGAVTLTNGDITNVTGVDLSTVEEGATADQTGAEIKTLYEGELDTNAFTDQYKSDVDNNTANRHTHTNKASLDTIDQNMASTDSVTFAGVNVGGGAMTWNSDDVSLDIPLNAHVTLQTGQEQVNLVRNNTGATIANGTAVMAVGTLGAGGRIVVAPHDGTLANAMRIVGIATEDIADGADGFATSYGKIRGLDTSAWNDGDVLYVAPNDSGSLTNIEPLDTETSMPVAFVIHSGTNGVIMTRVTGFDMNHYKAWVQGKLDIINTALSGAITSIDTLNLAVGTSAANVRYDKRLSALDVVAMDYTSGDLDYVRYTGDDDSTVYYRDVMTYGVDGLDKVDHFYGTADLVTPSAITTLTYTAGNLTATTYTE